MAVDPRAKDKRLLVLGAGPAQLGLLEAARERGLFVIALDRDPSAVGFVFADRRALISTEDEFAIERLAEAESVDGLIAPGIDWPVAIAARVAAKLALPHPLAPETAQLATSKQRQREVFAAAGVPQPGYAVVGRDEAPRDAIERVGYPCVVKAPDRQGQQGLSVVRAPEELDAAVAKARAASRGGAILVEELVDGPEVTVVGYSVAGSFHPLVVTDRERGSGPAFGVALAHIWPSPHQEAGAVAANAAAALGIEDGPTYTQIVCSPSGPKVGELAARLGGGHDAELCLAATGIDLNALAIAAALGEEVPSPSPNGSGGAVTRFLVPPVGELKEVHGVEEAERIDGVLRVRIYRRPGHQFGELRRGGDRAGAVLAIGADRGEALERAARAADLIRFETVDD